MVGGARSSNARCDIGDIGWERVREMRDGVAWSFEHCSHAAHRRVVRRAGARSPRAYARKLPRMISQPQLPLTRRRIRVLSDSKRRALQRGVRGKTRDASSRRTRAPFTPHQV